jgi:hypothetical protein
MIKIFYIAVMVFLFSACKKNTTEEAPIQTVTMDIKSLDLNFHLRKVHNLTDSIYFEFTSKNLYDCDKYVINLSADVDAKTINITLGNIYKIIGFCNYGGYPAIGNYKSPALAIGQYNIVVKKENTNYEGKLTVSNTNYSFSWEHDAHCMEIHPKLLNK